MEEQTVDRAEHRARPDGVADRDQNARHQRRRICERQCGASVRESDAALEFHPDALDFLHRQRTDLLPRPDGEEPEARLDGLGGDDGSCLSAACCFAGGPKSNGNPIHQQLGVAAADGNMEGKEVRFGIFNSALFATITTDASCGAVNSMHDSFTALGGFVPLFKIQLGEIIIGGVGAGLYGMLVFVVLAVFIAGPHGRPHAGISRQEDRGLRREDGDALAAHACPFRFLASPPGQR